MAYPVRPVHHRLRRFRRPPVPTVRPPAPGLRALTVVSAGVLAATVVGAGAPGHAASGRPFSTVGAVPAAAADVPATRTALPNLPMAYGVTNGFINERGDVAGTGDYDEGDVATFWSGGRVVSLNPPSSPRTVVRDLNDNSQVLLQTFDTSQSSLHAYLWEAGRFTKLESPGVKRLKPVDLNERGQVAMVSDPAHKHSSAWLWSQGQVTKLDPPGASAVEALRINDAGQVLIRYDRVTEAGTTRHLGLTDGATHHEIIEVPAKQERFSILLNNRGQVAVSTGEEYGDAYLWQSGRLTRIPVDNARVRDLNERGQVVGELALPDSTTSIGAFLWNSATPTRAATTMFRLGTQIRDLNERGQVVGWSAWLGVINVPLLWENGRVTDLPVLLDGGTGATRINEKGVIIGTASTITEPYSQIRRGLVWVDGKVADLGQHTTTWHLTDSGHVLGAGTGTDTRTYTQLGLLRWRVS